MRRILILEPSTFSYPNNEAVSSPPVTVIVPPPAAAADVYFWVTGNIVNSKQYLITANVSPAIFSDDMVINYYIDFTNTAGHIYFVTGQITVPKGQTIASLTVTLPSNDLAYNRLENSMTILCGVGAIAPAAIDGVTYHYDEHPPA